MKTSESSPADWFRAAMARMNSADRLHVAEGASEAAVELLHEAVERLLKAFLIANGWHLIRTHDLSRLLAEGIARDPSFESIARTGRMVRVLTAASRSSSIFFGGMMAATQSNQLSRVTG